MQEEFVKINTDGYEFFKIWFATSNLKFNKEFTIHYTDGETGYIERSIFNKFEKDLKNIIIPYKGLN
jgi:hypothetical protein